MVNSANQKTITIEERIRKFIRYLPIPAALRLAWVEKLIDREFTKEIQELRKRGDRNAVASKEHDHQFELQLIYEGRESLYTERLVKRAQRLRVHVPSKPKYTKDFEFEESEDWILGIQGDWYLTVKGWAKVREEIRKEEKWRREGRANWAVVLSALGGVIGTVIGLVSIFRK